MVRDAFSAPVATYMRTSHNVEGPHGQSPLQRRPYLYGTCVPVGYVRLETQ